MTRGVKAELLRVPAYSGIRKLAKQLKCSPKEAFKRLGGETRHRRLHVNFDGVSYQFPSLGSVIVPFALASKLGESLGKGIELLEVEPDHQQAHANVTPVITLVGHFNHGKTTLLDALVGSGSKAVLEEPGGITQEIRARTLQLERKVTLLDTPGQEIFYRMRTNGVSVADAAVLVVSAVEGVCLQTQESIGCIEEMGIPCIVALNKVDLLPCSTARRERILALEEELREYVATAESSVIQTSAVTGLGLDELKQAMGKMVSRNKSADVRRCMGQETSARATLIDFVRDAKRGSQMVLLVGLGVLRPGGWFCAGLMMGYIRTLYDEKGVTEVKEGRAGELVRAVCSIKEMKGDMPLGMSFAAMSREQAQQVHEVRWNEVNLSSYACVTWDESSEDTPLTDEEAIDMEGVHEADQVEEPAEDMSPLPVVLVASSGNELAAVMDCLGDHPLVVVAKASVGMVNPSDLMVSKECNSLIFALNVKADHLTREKAKHQGVSIRQYLTAEALLDDIEAMAVDAMD